MDKLIIDFYGVITKIQSNKKSLIENLKKDFSFFVVDTKRIEQITLTCLFVDTIPFKNIPPIASYQQGNNCISYQSNKLFFHDYHGEALIIEDGVHFEIFSDDESYLHELCYLTTLSRSSERLDLMGFHKIHASAVYFSNQFHLFMMPMKGGKSSFFLDLLQEDKNMLAISDDSPLIDSKARVYSFMTRVGVNNQEEAKNFNKTYSIKRKIYGVKYLIPVENFNLHPKHKPVGQGKIYIAIRTRSLKPLIIKANLWQAFRALNQHFLLGMGLPQLIEFFIQPTTKSYKNKLIITLKRLWSLCAILYKQEFYFFYLTHDRKKNVDYFLKWTSK